MKKKNFDTPYFFYNREEIRRKADFLSPFKEMSNCKLFYSVKALSQYKVLKEIASFVDGFSVSSLFEAQLARKVSRGAQDIHFISLGIKSDQWEMISDVASLVVFNSLEQFTLFKDRLKKSISYGIRVNPEISFVEESRYDPCRKISKLGVPISCLKKEIQKNNSLLNGINGLHFHTNCDSEDLSQLKDTFLRIKGSLGDLLHQFKWINLGGGYLFDRAINKGVFYDLINEIKKDYNFENIIIEPGSFFVRDSGRLVSSVIDVFQRNGQNIAVLDTTVNHLPEVFEYQYEPDVLDHDSSYPNKYILAGCSCLPGDIFGEYSFKNKLNVGSMLTFLNVGSYSLVKAHTFNGINLPDIYLSHGNIQQTKIKGFTLNEYIHQCGG